MRLLPHSIRARLVLAFGIGASLVLVLCLLLLYVALDQQLRAALDADLTGRADDLAGAVDTADLATISGDPMAQLYAPDGSVVTSSTSLAGQRLLTVDQVLQAQNGALVTRALPLGARGRLVDIRLLSRQVGGSGQVLALGVPAGVVQNASTGLFTVLAIVAPLLVALLVVAVWLVVRAALRPVGVLSREAAAISSLDTGRRLPPVPGDDEIARLARTLDGMLARLGVAFERERAFVDDASHELRTPIAVLRGEIDLALSALDDRDEVHQSLIAAKGQVERLGRLAEDLLLLARGRAGSLIVRHEPVDVFGLLTGEADTLERALNLRVDVRGEPVVVEADTDRLRQIFANLVVNSAAAGASMVRVQITRDRDLVCFEVADDGPGFAPGLVDSAFERFVRGAESRTTASGAGLGLSIVRAVVAAHRGTVEARNGQPLGGAVVTVRVPLS